MDFRYCYYCLETEEGLCYDCVKYYNSCLNCIFYGEGTRCENCSSDEGICLDDDVLIVLEYIDRNYAYFQTDPDF
jgi:hypothetical protein